MGPTAASQQQASPRHQPPAGQLASASAAVSRFNDLTVLLPSTLPAPSQDVPKDVQPNDYIDRFHHLYVPNAYTALAPFVGGLNGAPDLNRLHVVDAYNGNLQARMFGAECAMPGVTVTHLLCVGGSCSGVLIAPKLVLLVLLN